MSDTLLIVIALHFVTGIICTYGYEFYLSEGSKFTFTYKERIGLFFFGYFHLWVIGWSLFISFFVFIHNMIVKMEKRYKENKKNDSF